MAALINDVPGRFGGGAPSSVAIILNATEQLDEVTLSLLETGTENLMMIAMAIGMALGGFGIIMGASHTAF